MRICRPHHTFLSLAGDVGCAYPSSINITMEDPHAAIIALVRLADDGCRRRLACGHGLRATGQKQGTALPATDHGPAQRRAETARRAGDENLQCRDRRPLQSDDAQPGAGTAAVRSLSLSALGDFSADPAERVRDPDHRPAMALPGRVVCPRAAGAEGGPVAGDHCRTESQQASHNHVGG